MRNRLLGMAVVICMLLSLAFTTGCNMGTINVDKRVVKVVTRMAVRNVVYAMAIKNPEIIGPGIAAMETITGESADREVIDGVVKGLIDSYKNKDFVFPTAFIKEDLADLLELVGISLDGTFEKLDLGAVKFIAQAALQGLYKARELKHGV